MPTKNPRLSVVLSPALAATLAALSQETGDSASSLVRGLLDQTEPALQRMLQLLRAAKQAKGEIGGGFASSITRVVDDLEDAMALADHRTGRAMRDLVDTAQQVKGRRRATGAGGARRAPAAVSTPVPVTRGSGTGKTRRKGVDRG
jgi:hypothetical protein